MATVACPTCGRENPEGFEFCGYCGAPLAAAPAQREVRKIVTIVFSDVTGSTALGERLDPESLRRVMTRYFDEMRAVLERHGGTVEKFIGDAVMAVFGIPVLHEDDALRAVRAAAEMGEALAELNADLDRERGVTIATRTGVNTGEVVAGDPAAGQTLVTGDAVNTAARLEQAAAPGDVLLGDSTYSLVRDAVRAEPVEPLEMKGKADPVPAYRLVEVLPDTAGHARNLDAPMVGRDRELGLITDAFDRARSAAECHLFTLLGPAGVGKSRLVEEFLARVGVGVTVLRGRCLPYGEGITFYPVADVVRQAVGEAPIDDEVGRLLEDSERAPMVVQRLSAVLGFGDDEPVTAEEAFWAVRTLFEGIAHRRPLVLVFDDIHWGEPTFLDLIDHVAQWSRDAPILLLCVARSELLDVRPAWGGGKMNASSILLEPLSLDEADELIGNLLGSAGLEPGARARITEAAEGNPLYVEEMLSMLIDEGILVQQDGGWTPAVDLSTVAVPPTIQALLAARLDRLDGSERSVIDRASVVGKEFWRGAVVELSPEPERREVPANLMTLVRKELIRPGRSTLAGDDAFRFRHLLIRDAAYDSMSKEHRAELHERLAGWLQRVAGPRAVEFEEILGYHLEQAVRYRRELGSVDEAASDVSERAGAYLASAGERAFARGDVPAAANLLGRAIELLEPGSLRRTRLWPPFVEALDIGVLSRQREALETGLAEARAAGDRGAELRLEILAIFHRSNTDPSLTQGEMSVMVGRARDELRAIGDDAGAAFASIRLALVEFWLGHAAAAFETARSAFEQARRTGDRGIELRSLEYLVGPLTWGPFPIEEAMRWSGELRERAGGHQAVEVFCLALESLLMTLLGRFDEGRALFDRCLRLVDELGMTALRSSLVGQLGTQLCIVSGDLDTARALGRRGVDELRRMGETGYLSTSAGYLAWTLYLSGEDEEAERMVELGRESAAPDDFSSQELWRRVKALILSRRGEHEEAEALAREAVRLTADTDYLLEVAGTRMALGRVLDAAGRPAEAAAEVRAAVDLIARKGATVLLERAMAELARLEADAD